METTATATAPAYDVERVRADFAVLSRTHEGSPIVYLDNAATSLKPRPVLDAVRHYDEQISANIHRGKHLLSEEASELFEQARRKVASFLGAAPQEVIFTSNTTHAINLVALGLPGGGNVVTTLQEHHSNLLPFFDRYEVRLAPVDESGHVDAARVLALIDQDTRLVAVSRASNVTGAVHELGDIIAGAAAKGVPVLVDAAQAVPHMKVDVRALGCDFLAFSGHKMLGPTGIGVLYGKRERLEALGSPLRGGGVPRLVTATGYTLKGLPYRLEPGTPPIAQAIGLAAAVDYLAALGEGAIAAHEERLARRLVAGLSSLNGVRLLGPPPGQHRLAVASFAFDSAGLSPDHVAMILSDTHKVMVRSGHHCCHPFFDSLGLTGAVRASAYLYNTEAEVDVFLHAVARVLGQLHV